jgi:bifunctional non-homologous end joining protein LigD
MATKKQSADAVDKQLARYRSMRDFKITAEPSGAATKTNPKLRGTKFPFVIQKHAASHLHYDFRLGWNGVLKSWAVAKGPSFNPKDRRLAVQVEDHPIEYGGFEGIIPKGQYGGGTVMVWDQGTWHPQPGFEDVTAALRNGELKFELDGTKLKGKWVLVRMGGARWEKSSKPNWLLIKEHDEFERDPKDKPITDEKPNSAVTGRSLEQIAAEEDHVWNSKQTAKPGQAWFRQPSKPPDSKLKDSKLKTLQEPSSSANGAPYPSPGRSPGSSPTSDVGGLKARSKIPPATTSTALAKLPKESQPAFIAPQLALEATAPPATGDWLHELKLDGYRVQARKAGTKVKLLTRKGLDWTHRMPAVAEAIAGLPAKNATLDGEVVVLGPDGNSSFAELQASFQDGAKHPLTYFVFDLLHLDGHNPRNLPLRERKRLLASLLPKRDGTLRLSEDIAGDGAAIFRHACALHAEGIVSKRADAPYRGTRSGDWLKSKCLREQELVIGGFTTSTEGTDRIGALLLGYYQSGKLIYAGRTGTGFTQKLKRDLLTRLSKLKLKSSAFDRVPAAAQRGAVWVKPKLVAQVRFATWTADGLVRQAAFLGLREDKPATEVTRERATVAPRPKASHRSPTPLAARVVSKARAKPALAPATVRLTHPDKVLDPETGLTKRQLADYYLTIAPLMLPHITGRPLSLVRCPDGAGKPCFFQKHMNSMPPPGIGSVSIADKAGKREPYITLEGKQATPETVAGFAQMGVLEVHPWGSRNADLEHPDRLIFDLDPDPSLPWSTLAAAAAEVRRRLRKAGLESFLKLTGGKGLHVVAPIEPKISWENLKSASHTLVLSMQRDHPDLYLTKMTKSARAGKIFLDYLRNERGATAVAPYSPRARLGTHVSLPLPWTALKEPRLPVFSVTGFAEWKSRLRSDPWKSLPSTLQRLDLAKFDAL